MGVFRTILEGVGRYFGYVRGNKPLLFATVAYLVIGFLFLPYFQYIFNHDGVSYFSLSQYYIEGDFKLAVNGTWSPLLSWIMIPFIALGLSPTLWFRILSLFLGVLTLMLLDAFFERFSISKRNRHLMSFVTVPVLLYFALVGPIAPDMLSALFALLYIYIITKENALSNKKLVALAAIVAAIGYFARSFMLPFFVAHFTLFVLIEWWRRRHKIAIKEIAKTYAVGMLVFVILISPWVFAISMKYDKLTFSTSGPYNYRLVGPDAVRTKDLSFVLTRVHASKGGLSNPSNEKAITAHEDLSYIELKGWSPFDSIDNAWHQMVVFINNLVEFKNFFVAYSVLSFGILWYALYSARQQYKKTKEQTIQKLHLIFAVFVYIAGYSLVLFEERYTWVAYLGLLILLAAILQEVVAKKRSQTAITWVLIFVALASFTIYPVKEIYLNRNRDKSKHQVATHIQENYPFYGKSAANSNNTRLLGRYVSYYLGNQFYNMIRQDLPEEQAIEDLNEREIEFLYVHEADERKPEFLQSCNLVAQEPTGKIFVYSLKENNGCGGVFFNN